MRTTIVSIFSSLAIVAGASPVYAATFELRADKVVLQGDNCFTQDHLRVQAGYISGGYKERHLCSVDTTIELDKTGKTSARLKVTGKLFPGFEDVGGFSFVDLNVSLENAIGTGFRYSKSSGKGELGAVSQGLPAGASPFSYSPVIQYVNSLDITLAGNSYKNKDPLKLDQDLDRGGAYQVPTRSFASYGALSEWYKFGEDLAEGNEWLGQDTNEVKAKGYFTDVLINKSNPSGFLQGLNSLTVDYIPTNDILKECLNRRDCFNFESVTVERKTESGTVKRPSVTGHFSPNTLVKDIQMADLAKALGFEHLNWLQLIIANTDPNLIVLNGFGDTVKEGVILNDGFSTKSPVDGDPAYWDTPKGGNILWKKSEKEKWDKGEKEEQNKAYCLQSDEYMPYYSIVQKEDNPNVKSTNLLMAEVCRLNHNRGGIYSESILDFTDQKFLSGSQLEKKQALGVLSFFDSPILEQGHFEFFTLLAGVKADKSIVPVVVETGSSIKIKKGFSTRWLSNLTKSGSGGTTVYSSSTPIGQIEELDNLTYTGGVEVKEVITTFSDAELAQLRSWFGDFDIIDLGDNDNIDVPEEELPTSVPEPSVFVGLLCTVLGLRLLRRR
jgi:hypothetical protein